MNFYEVLGVSRDAPPDEVRRAYRRRARGLHPDVNDHPRARDQFRVLVRAKEVLVDPDERAAYDRLGHAEYVEKRIDGTFPDTSLIPESWDDDGIDVDGPREENRVPSDDPTGGPAGPPDDSGSEQGGPTGGTGEPGSNRGPTSTDAPAGTSEGDAHSGRVGSNRSRTSTPPTPGTSARTERTPPRGPQRISDEPTPDDWRRRTLAENLVDHFVASTWWLGVVAAAGAYAVGLLGFLGAHRAGVDDLVSALRSSDPPAVAGALGDERYGVPSVTAHASDVGFLTGLHPTDAALLLAGAVILPASVALAVSGLRRATTWRPTWLYVAGALGPGVAAALGHVAGTRPESLPVSTVPLLVDLLFLVAFPGIAVGAFLVNRLVTVWPLLRREDLGVP